MILSRRLTFMYVTISGNAVVSHILDSMHFELRLEGLTIVALGLLAQPR